jgi:hypothetical protein
LDVARGTVARRVVALAVGRGGEALILGLLGERIDRGVRLDLVRVGRGRTVVVVITAARGEHETARQQDTDQASKTHRPRIVTPRVLLA